jgi:hypothetical protein
MTTVRIDEALWAGAMAPEGVLVSWAAEDDGIVQRGAHLADVVIEGARHEIMAPADGRLRREAEPFDVVEPGTVIGQITPT